MRSDNPVKDDRLYLHHMLERCQRISRFIRPGREVFFESEDVLIHDYIGVDLDEVWNVAYFRIPELRTILERFLAEQDAGSGLSQ